MVFLPAPRRRCRTAPTSTPSLTTLEKGCGLVKFDLPETLRFMMEEEDLEEDRLMDLPETLRLMVDDDSEEEVRSGMYSSLMSPDPETSTELDICQVCTHFAGARLPKCKLAVLYGSIRGTYLHCT